MTATVPPHLDMLRASAAAFAAKESPVSRMRALRADPRGLDAAAWRKIAALGWTGLLVPEALGGHGQGLAEMAVVAEALSAQLAPEPLTPVAVFAARLLQGCRDSEIARSLLTGIAEGRSLPAVAWQEDTTGSAAFDRAGRPAAPSASCERSGDGWSLSGGKRHIRPGGAASGYIVSAMAAGEMALVWLPAPSAGLSSTSELLADGSYADRLVVDRARVPAEHLIAIGPPAESAFAAAYDEALVLCGAELLALSRRMLTMTLDYLRTRRQFGKPIGSFQSLQHRAVDMFIQQELSAAVLAQALAEIDRGCPGTARARLAARVKARCGDAALLIAREAVQLHGAIGITDEYDLGLYMQRALVLSAWLGNATAQRRRFAALGQQAQEEAAR